MLLQFQNQSDARMCRKFMTSWLQALELELKKRKVARLRPHTELVIVWLKPVAMKKLNSQFRGRSYATDILSFEPSEANALGELVLCPEVLRRQAKEHGLSFQQEVGYMLIHGVLHLLGFDHETNKRDAKRMFDLQDAVFEILCRLHETGTSEYKV